MSTDQEIRAVLETALAPLGVVVEDVSVSPAGKRRLVRVLVDRDISDLEPSDGTSRVTALTLDDVADASRAVDVVLEEGDVMGSTPYVLEVSSPGVGRALTSRDQFRRQVGRLVEVRHPGGTDTGRLLEVGADHLELEVPPTKKTPSRRVTVAVADVERGTVQVEFTHHDSSTDGRDADDPSVDHAPADADASATEEDH